MQYINGFDVSAQGISEIIAINDKVKLPKVYERDGVSLFERASGKRKRKQKLCCVLITLLEFYYVGKSQSIIYVPPEYAYTTVRNTDYSFLPGCIEHKLIEKYPK